MTPERDQRRMDAYRRIIQPDSGSADAERAVARSELGKLEAKYGTSAPRGPTWTHGAPAWTWTSWAPNPAAERRQQEERRQRDAARAEAARQSTIAAQRKRVSAVPFWRVSPVLTRLHDIDGVWTTEEARQFDAERSAKSPKPDGVALAGVLHSLGMAWAGELTAEETKWIGQEVCQIGKSRRPTRLAMAWLGMRYGRGG